MSAEALDAARQKSIRMYNAYVPNKTISVPDDVLPIIDGLDVPFSRWVTEQLRHHAAESTVPFTQQLQADAELAERDGSGMGQRSSRANRADIGERMGRSAPW